MMTFVVEISQRHPKMIEEIDSGHKEGKDFVVPKNEETGLYKQHTKH